MILKGKRILLAGMSDRRSIGYAIAQEVQREGAELLLTSFGRMMSITQMTAKKLDPVPEILEMDVTKASDIDSAVDATSKRWDRLDGLVHSVAFAPADALGGKFLSTPWESVAMTLQVSAFSFKELARGFLPLMRDHGGSMVTLDFDNSTSAWPKYDWMGVSKAALESVTRYLARDLGRYKIRVNAVCAGPLATLAASAIRAHDNAVIRPSGGGQIQRAGANVRLQLSRPTHVRKAERLGVDGSTSNKNGQATSGPAMLIQRGVHVDHQALPQTAFLPCAGRGGDPAKPGFGKSLT
ncbi:MAG: SDR family oxidoreductase [Chloroflexi bacterium]|nr:MAG: SDR family oxidoreductase [Chloroflexota bacterium]